MEFEDSDSDTAKDFVSYNKVNLSPSLVVSPSIANMTN